MIRAGLLEQINTRPASAEADALSLLPEEVRNVLTQTHGCQRVLADLNHELAAIDAELVFLGGFLDKTPSYNKERVEHLFEKREWTRTDFDLLYDFYILLTERLSVIRTDGAEDKKETDMAKATA